MAFVSDVIQYKAHIALYLAHHGIAGAAFLQLHNEVVGLVLTDGQNINCACITWVLLPDQFAFIFDDVIVTPKLGLRPVADKKVFEVLFKRKDTRVFDQFIG